MGNTGWCVQTSKILPDYDISQEPTRNKLMLFMRLMQRNPEFIEKFKKGYCSGIAFLTLLSLKLEKQTNNDISQSRDDFTWLLNTLEIISAWDEDIKSLSDSDKKNIDHFIELIEILQNINEYALHGQGNVDQFSIEILGIKITSKFVITGNVSQHDFFKPITLKNNNQTYTTNLFDIISKHKDNIILVTSFDHDTGIAFTERHHLHINANYKKLMAASPANEKSQVVSNIFHSHAYQKDEASPLGLRIFSFNDEPNQYPDPIDVLNALSLPLKSTSIGAFADTSPLHIAALFNNVTCAKFYLDNKIDANLLNHEGCTALNIAASHHSYQVANLLIQHGADINTRDAKKLSPIAYTVRFGNIALTELLLKYNASCVLSNKNTLLHVATYNNKPEMVSFLIKQNFHVNEKNAQNITPISIAIMKKHLEIAYQLILAEAKINHEESQRLFLDAAYYGHVKLIKTLLQLNVDPNTITLKSDFAAIHYAAAKNQANVITELLATKKVDANKPLSDGRTPLHLAAMFGHVKSVSILIAHGVNLEAKTNNGMTPLEIATYYGQLDVTILLMQHGAHIPDKVALRAIILATKNHRFDILAKLNDHGFSINLQNAKGWTPLHFAAADNNIDIVSNLLRLGADATRKNQDGKLPIDLTKNIKIRDLLAMPALARNNASFYFSPSAQNPNDQKAFAPVNKY